MVFIPNIVTNHAITYTNTTVVAIFPNVCLWRRSLCSDLVLTLKNRIEPPFICQDGLCCCNMALISFRLFRKNLGNLRDFFGQMGYRPPWQKNSRTPMRRSRSRSRKRSKKSAYDLVKIKNRSSKRSHKGDGIGVRRIRMFPFPSDSAYDSVAYVPLMI